MTSVRPLVPLLGSVELARDWIHDLPSSLRIEALCLHQDATSLQYSFRVTHRGELLAEGRAAVLLTPRTE